MDFPDFLLAELPALRRREAVSSIAHYIAGMLDRAAMIEIIENLCQTSDLKPGDAVKTLRGSTRGVIVRVRPDGRIVRRPDQSRSELTVLPESLVRIP